jgi:hypothetical protein
MKTKPILSSGLFILLSLSAFGCTAHPAKQIHTPGDTALIYKPSESVQCKPGSGISLQKMQKQLTDAGINPLCMKKLRDGIPRIAVCGAQNGELNVYKIPADQLAAAKAADFLGVEKLTRVSFESICEAPEAS